MQEEAKQDMFTVVVIIYLIIYLLIAHFKKTCSKLGKNKEKQLCAEKDIITVLLLRYVLCFLLT